MASLIDRLVALVKPGIDARAFYSGKTLTKVGWWLSPHPYPELYWGRLRVFSDGTADAAFDEADVYGFQDANYAGYFLAEDEYTPSENLDARDEEHLGVKASELTPPTWSETPARFHYLGIY